jgi:hypothetical protein
MKQAMLSEEKFYTFMRVFALGVPLAQKLLGVSLT